MQAFLRPGVWLPGVRRLHEYEEEWEIAASVEKVSRSVRTDCCSQFYRDWAPQWLVMGPLCGVIMLQVVSPVSTSVCHTELSELQVWPT